MKKSPARRLLFWIVFALYAAGSAWWILTVPGNPAQLLRAIPGNAALVSWHDQLAARWPAISSHPVTLSVVGAMQGDQDEWMDLQADPGFKATLDLIGKNELVLAYVPYLGIYNERAWVFAGWIGGQSQRLRWSHRFLDIPGLHRMENIGGWPVWTWNAVTENGSFRITLALVEGMIVGCTARDPMAIETVIESYTGLFPSVANRLDLGDWNKLLLESDYADRFWFKSEGVSYLDRIFTELDIQDATRMNATVRFFPPSEIPVLPETISLDELGALWGDEALAASAFGSELVVGAIQQAGSSLVTSTIKDIIATSRTDAMAVALFGGDYSGRFKGVKMPTAMVALNRSEGGDIADWIQPLIDRWNARYQWGLVPVPVGVGTTTVWRIEGTSNSLYANLAATEQIALVSAGDWIVISSNFKGLEALLARRALSGGASPADWVDRLDDAISDAATGYVGVDLVRGNEALRLAITAYSLKLLFEDASGTRDIRQRLNEAKAWLEILARLEQLHIIVSHADPYVKVDLQTGAP